MFTLPMCRWFQQLRRWPFEQRSKPRRRAHGWSRSESLEPRTVLSAEFSLLGTMQLNGEIDATLPAESRTLFPLSSLPALHSNSAATAKLYLDFDGHFETQWGVYQNLSSPVFSLDADLSTFSGWELATLAEVWAIVAEDFAPFNLDVTTVEPASFGDGEALRVVIGGSNSDWFGGGYGGVGTHGGFSNVASNVVYVFPDDHARTRDEATFIADIVSHEAGHALGLDHQALFDANGVLLNCYRPGANGVDPIMGGSSNANRTTWALGPSTSATTIQDDLAILAGPQNGFGYRPDDHGSLAVDATPLLFTGGRAEAHGIITQMSDRDAFHFHSDGGTAIFNVSPALLGANLVSTAELRSLAGQLLSTATSTDAIPAILQAELPAGDYLLVVSGNGEYGSVGQYTIETSITLSALSVPVAPRALQVTSGYGYRTELSWSAISDATGYRIYRRSNSTTPESLVAVLPAGTSQTTIRVPHFPVETFEARWFSEYRVEAFNASGVATSRWQRVQHQFHPPFAASNIQLTPQSETAVTLSWTPDPKAVGYSVQAWEFVGNWSWVFASSTTVSADQTNHAITDLTPGHRYRFKVNAFTEGGTRDLFYDFTLPHLLAPAAPNLQVSLLPSKTVNLTWDSVPGATGYYVSLLDDRGTWRKGTLSASETSFQISGLERSKPYRFIVDALNANGATATISEPLTIPYNPPAQPTGLTATALSTTEVQLTWQSASAAAGYRIYRYRDGDNRLLATVGADQTSFNISDLTANTGYNFMVAAFNDDGTSFGWAPFVTTLAEPPTAPSNVQVTTLSSTAVRLTWTDSLRETSYEIQQGSSNSAVRAINSTSCNWYGLVPGATYQFRVVAKNNGGATASEWVTIRIPNPPTAPTNLQANTQSATSIGLTWSDARDESEYRLFVQSGTSRTLLATLSADTTRYVAIGLNPDTEYRFVLEAVNLDGQQTANFFPVRTLPFPPTAPKNLTATVMSPSIVRLNWNDADRETSYLIERSTAGATAGYGAANSNFFTVVNLQANQSYRFRVIAVNSGGNSASDWITVQTPSLPTTAPTGLQASAVSTTSLTLRWNDAANETGYRVYRTDLVSEQLVAQLTANSTQFAVTGLASNTSYRFRVVSFNTSGEATSGSINVTTLTAAINDNSLAAARNLGTLSSTPTAVRDFVGGSDTQDFYRITLTQARTLSLRLSGLISDADVQLLDSQGRVVASSTRGGTSAEDITRSLAAGTYFIRVYQYRGDTNYDLTLSAV